MLSRIYCKLMGYIKSEEGATAIEYALLAALIAVAIAVGAGALGTNLNDFFQMIGDWLGVKVTAGL